MPFDPLKPKPLSRRPHVVTPATGPNQPSHCIICGTSADDIAWLNVPCDPTSEAATKFRRSKSDAMVGRITGNSTQ